MYPAQWHRGVFSDDIRDAIKGKVFDPMQKGYVSGGHHLEQTIRAGIVAHVRTRR